SSIVSKPVKNVFAAASRSVDRADNVILFENNPIFCKRVSFDMGDLSLNGYLYHDPRGRVMRDLISTGDWQRRDRWLNLWF
ncbi:MAG: hypothetical protein QXU18_13675, partial [Thermoplasmatales archaeon]